MKENYCLSHAYKLHILAHDHPTTSREAKSLSTRQAVNLWVAERMTHRQICVQTEMANLRVYQACSSTTNI